MRNIIHMFRTHEDAKRAFIERTDEVKDFPEVQIWVSDLRIEGQGMCHRFMACDGSKLRGLEVERIFIDEVGPFFGPKI